MLPKGSSIYKVSWHDSIYRFPTFEPGRITFATGFTPEKEIMFNYNLYFMRIELINDKGDTVEVVPSHDIKHIEIGSRQFVVTDVAAIDIDNRKFVVTDVAGFVEVIVKPSPGLAAVRFLRDEKREYWPYRRVSDVRGEPTVLDRYYKKVTSYHFIDDRMRLHAATKPIIISFFRGYKKEISNYIEENRINFDNESDLIKLLDYCNQLEVSPKE